MKKEFCFLLPAVVAFGWSVASAQPASVLASGTVAASGSVPKRGRTHFHEMHESFLRRRHEPMGLLFIGDSITEWWSRAPEVWKQYYEKYQPANFGIAGDQTQQVIWRIENGELDGIRPKVAVLLLGTNNTARVTEIDGRVEIESLPGAVAEIVADETKIVRSIRERIPGAKVLLLAIFPRGPRMIGTAVDPWEERMEIIRAVNAELAKLDDGRSVRFLDIGAHFLGADGKISTALMPDQLHPSAAGYKRWAEAMQPLLDEMMK